MLWKVAFLKLHTEEVAELGFETGLSEYRARESNFGEIIPIFPPPQHPVDH